MENFVWFLAFGAVTHTVLGQEKWVWNNNRDSKQGFARGDGKGRYGVYEPEGPEEPFNPGARPPPSNLPPLIRPSGRPPPSNINNNDNRPLSFPSSNNNYNNVINNNRPLLPDNYNNRPLLPDNYNNRPLLPNNYNNRPLLPDNYNNRRPGGEPITYPGRPPVAVRPPPVRPPAPSIPPKTPQHPDNKDPTNFDKCKCAHSFNCKSPAILFGTCDVGKKYCCEKFSAPRPRGPAGGDLSDPPVLIGPGGPFDHIYKGQGNYERGSPSFGRVPPHSSSFLQ
uniref:Putative serine/threonine-protein kinase fhke n=1 Tax=Panstrongylus lignarius TaxID=156445 RepID=A0A224XVG2_9HEMI